MTTPTLTLGPRTGAGAYHLVRPDGLSAGLIYQDRGTRTGGWVVALDADETGETVRLHGITNRNAAIANASVVWGLLEDAARAAEYAESRYDDLVRQVEEVTS